MAPEERGLPDAYEYKEQEAQGEVPQTSVLNPETWLGLGLSPKEGSIESL